MTLDPDEWSGKKFRWLFQGHEELASFSSNSSLSSRNLFHASTAHQGGAVRGGARRGGVYCGGIFYGFLKNSISDWFSPSSLQSRSFTASWVWMYVHISVTLEGEFVWAELTHGRFSTHIWWPSFVDMKKLLCKSVNWKIIYVIQNQISYNFSSTT